jgi:hypothetical protein
MIDNNFILQIAVAVISIYFINFLWLFVSFLLLGCQAMCGDAPPSVDTLSDRISIGFWSGIGWPVVYKFCYPHGKFVPAITLITTIISVILIIKLR